MRKAKVPNNISFEIRRFGLPRETSIQLCAAIHLEIPETYEERRAYRVRGQEKW
jgi:hypothetical protein